MGVRRTYLVDRVGNSLHQTERRLARAAAPLRHDARVSNVILQWARSHGVRIRERQTWARFAVVESVEGQTPASLSAQLRDDPTLDFGRAARIEPAAVLEPDDEQQVADALAACADAGVKARARGTGHSSGGQCLTPDVVIDLRRLDGVRVDADRAVVGGGALWWQLVEAAQHDGLRPPVLTSNPHTTVGGTLCVGGFGDTSHVYGLQIEHVEALRLALPDGRVVDAGPGDELFEHALGGRGEAGLIVSATIPLIRAPMRAQVRLVRWRSREAFAAGCDALLGNERLRFARLRYLLRVPGVPAHVVGAVGDLAGDDGAPDEDAFDALGADEVGALESIELDDRDPSFFAWASPCPALELVLPLPSGLDVVEDIGVAYADAGLGAAMPLGAAVHPLPGSSSRFPLSPAPRVDRCVVLALRPAVPAQALGLLQPFVEAGARAGVEAGGRLYRMSAFEADDALHEAMWGADVTRAARALRERVDPKAVLR
jgi:FAD/FMN-containing dehydrogenase